jgi:molybdopterin/thiamine biosynthesis adenylyltransferase
VTARPTIVLTTELHAAAVSGASALVARAVRSDRGLLLLGQRAGDDAHEDEGVVHLGPSGLDVTATTVAGTLPAPYGSVPVGAVKVVGDAWRLLLPTVGPEPAPHFDRQVRAFGPDGQRVLAQLRVGIVGGGGTGSALFEQLVRLGVGDILIVDPDEINEDGSNVTRVYGSTMADIGQPKVTLANRNADLIGLGTTVTAIRGTINDEATARQLTDCDVVFGCTDDNRGRVTLGRLSTWYLIPVIDMGVKITSQQGTLHGIEGRVTVIEPGRGCLQCRGRINAAALQSEVLDPVERAQRVDEGYAPGLEERDPAVIAYTTATAAHAANELLHRLFALDQEPPSGELIIRFHARDIRRNTRPGRPDHWCTDPSHLGAGDVVPFLGTTWAS